ncbi:MAG: hypothetical protein HC896_08170 [Bacteroidales bacterium]|nr:hypothetical protein [Bacteroidales bacterium]
MNWGNSFFALQREAENGDKLISVSNICTNIKTIELPAQTELSFDVIQQKTVVDNGVMELLPYQTVWLVKK